MLTVSDYGRPYLIIPWVVLQELDAMKGSRFKVGPPLKVCLLLLFHIEQLGWILHNDNNEGHLI